MVDVKVELQELKEESDSHGRGAGGRGRCERRIPASVDGMGRRPGVLSWRRRGRDAVASAAARASPPNRGAPHVERWAGSAASRPTAPRSRTARRVRTGQLDIWLKIGRGRGPAALTTDPRASVTPPGPRRTQIAFLRLVSGPPGSTSCRFRAARPGSTSCRRWAARPTPAVRLPGAGPGPPGPRWSLAGHLEVPLRGRPAGRHLPDLRRERRAACGDVPEGAGFHRRQPGLLAGRPGARLRFVRGHGGVPDLRRVRLPLDSELRPQERLVADPARVVQPRRGWTRDGRSIVYGGYPRLWRVRANGGAPPERVELAARPASRPP